MNGLSWTRIQHKELPGREILSFRTLPLPTSPLSLIVSDFRNPFRNQRSRSTQHFNSAGSPGAGVAGVSARACRSTWSWTWRAVEPWKVDSRSRGACTPVAGQRYCLHSNRLARNCRAAPTGNPYAETREPTRRVSCSLSSCTESTDRELLRGGM